MASFKPYPFAYIRGKYVPVIDANLSVMTNSLHYGAAVFGGMKAYETSQGIGVFRLSDHIARMQQSCKILRFPYEFDNEKVAEIILSLANKNKLHGKTYIRPLIYRSDNELSPGILGEYDLAVYMLDMSGTDYISNDKGLSVCISSWQRNSDNALPPRTKASGGYLNSSLAIHDARQSGFDSAILLNEHGEVGEGAVMNLFLVKNGQLITPSVDADILEGITRRTIIELAAELNIMVIERTINRSELYTADEIFFCGTAVEIAWCKSVDNIQITPIKGNITEKLSAAYHNLPSTHSKMFTLIK